MYIILLDINHTIRLILGRIKMKYCNKKATGLMAQLTKSQLN